MANILRRTETTPSVFSSTWDPFRSMRDLIRWDPFREMNYEPMAEMQTFLPAFEVKETKDAYVFKADLPGVKEKDLEITLTGTRLTVQGKREAEKKEETETFFTYERSYGSFTRAFTLPEGVDTEHMHADLKEGVLHLVLPKKPELQPKKIEVKTVPVGEKAKA